jgi:hypothetical protein
VITVDLHILADAVSPSGVSRRRSTHRKAQSKRLRSRRRSSLERDAGSRVTSRVPQGGPRPIAGPNLAEVVQGDDTDRLPVPFDGIFTVGVPGKKIVDEARHALLSIHGLGSDVMTSRTRRPARTWRSEACVAALAPACPMNRPISAGHRPPKPPAKSWSKPRPMSPGAAEDKERDASDADTAPARDERMPELVEDQRNEGHDCGNDRLRPVRPDGQVGELRGEVAGREAPAD